MRWLSLSKLVASAIDNARRRALGSTGGGART
jgi:hypothetical protein